MLAVIRNGLAAASNDISLISNNIANAGSTGFKRSSSQFVDSYVVEQTKAPGATAGSGVKALDPRRDHSQGGLKATGSALDLAISGTGMFQTVMPGFDGDVTYTRDGSMQLDALGRISNSDGRVLMAADGTALTVPLTIVDGENATQALDTISITEDGKIKAIYSASGIVNVGTIALANFANVAGLAAIGGGHFKQSDQSGAPRMGAPAVGDFGKVLGGNLEMSNINVTNELVRLMKAQQAYSGSSRVLQAETEIAKRLID